MHSIEKNDVGDWHITQTAIVDFEGLDLTPEQMVEWAEIARAGQVEKFKRLSVAQHRLMAFQCASNARSRPVTGEKLLKLGLVHRITRKIGNIDFTDYEVPIPIHMNYCDWCSQQEKFKL